MSKMKEKNLIKRIEEDEQKSISKYNELDKGKEQSIQLVKMGKIV